MSQLPFIDSHGWDSPEDIEQSFQSHRTQFVKYLQNQIKMQKSSTAKIDRPRYRLNQKPNNFLSQRQKQMKLLSQRSQLPKIHKEDSRLIEIKTIDISLCEGKKRPRKSERNLALNKSNIKLKEKTEIKKSPIIKIKGTKDTNNGEPRFKFTSVKKLCLQLKAKQQMRLVTECSLKNYLLKKQKAGHLQKVRIFQVPISRSMVV